MHLFGKRRSVVGPELLGRRTFSRRAMPPALYNHTIMFLEAPE
jgi:hypothetical protein